MEDGYQRRLAEAERLLDDVDRALGRLDAGTYARCEACGGPISPERLAEHPTARTCSGHTRLTDQPTDVVEPTGMVDPTGMVEPTDKVDVAGSEAPDGLRTI